MGSQYILVGVKGLSHDKIHSEFFATPPQSVTFVIRLPALRTAILGSSHLRPLGPKPSALSAAPHPVVGTRFLAR